MSPTRREVLAQLAGLLVLPLPNPIGTELDPLDGTIADYQTGRRRGAWTAAEITRRALDRCADALRDLGVVPAPETRRLIDRVRAPHSGPDPR
jgi:aspartyl-tRNA(Asn)/glutamyl-tRNA(Gln) amidotransferase subunit A